MTGLVYTSSPTQIGTSSWLAVSAGDSHSVALRSDYTIWAWGANYLGQLGVTNASTSTGQLGGGTSFNAFITADNKL